MAKKVIKLNDDLINLITNIKFESFVFDGDSRNGRYGWGIDQYAPWGGDYPIEDIALVLGHWGDYIKGTEEDPLGRRYPEEMEKQFLAYYYYINDNFEYIIDLVFKFAGKGGLVPGTYSCNPREKNWIKED